MASYRELTPASSRLFDRAKKVFAGGVNHNARYYAPYPMFVSRARGQHIWDEDGNRYVDYWMGHMALILGHSPQVVTSALRRQVGRGTHFGTGSRLSLELGEEVQKTVPCAEAMRFCNTGAEATMYLVRLARGYTRRRTVVKMAGGWHGYGTELNKGVRFPFSSSEGEGILAEEQAHVKTARFNDAEDARRAVAEAKGDVAAIFLEPVLGAGGCIPAKRGYLEELREIADGAGALLAFDEIVTGYRLSLGGAQEAYGVVPDVATLGKVAGGGLPIGMVCGSKEVLSMADPARKAGFVSIGGGTFSENPLSMAAGLATVRYLRTNRSRVYGDLERKGRELRTGVDSALSARGVEAHTTGAGSLFLTHFGVDPSDAESSAKGDAAAAHRYAIGMMERGGFIQPGHPGAVSTAHTERDIRAWIAASAAVGEQMERKRKSKVSA